MNAQEILQRYAVGQRDFSRVTLIQECPTSSNLIGAYLTDADLIKDTKQRRKLTKAHLYRARKQSP